MRPKLFVKETCDHEFVRSTDNYLRASLSDFSRPPSDVNISDAPSTSTNLDHGLAIRHLNLTIEAGQRVVICGRTGSGKSSLLRLILRLLDPVSTKMPMSPEKISPFPAVTVPISEISNTIVIDGVPLCRVDRTTLRERIIAIPQEAVLLPEGCSFRQNLDPEGVATEEDCRAVLNVVAPTANLWSLVETKGGLQEAMNPGALSQGQEQLFSLARAILRKRCRPCHQIERGEARAPEGGILMLDEMSSSVDIETERSMHAAIRKEFAGYTIIMVSHHLEMIMDYDRVVMMEHGSMVESGVPKCLLETEGSRFRGLVMEISKR